MKRTLLATSIGLLTLFSTSGHAELVYYIESGNDGLGDAFKIEFQFDNTTNTVTGALNGSFTDSSGTYSGITTLASTSTINYGNGITGYEFEDSNPNPNLLAIILNTSNPMPLVNDTPGFYATTISQAGQITYNTAPTIVDPPVPLPGAVWMFGSSIIAFLSLRNQIKPKG